MINSSPISPPEILNLQLQQLRLSRMLQHLPSLEQQAIQDNWSYTSASRILRFPQNRERHVNFLVLCVILSFLIVSKLVYIVYY
jgi:hypothetical protein